MRGARKEHLELEITEINEIIGWSKQLVLTGSHGRNRIELHVDGQMERYMSPSLPKAQLHDWLDGFRRGLNMGTRIGKSEE